MTQDLNERIEQKRNEIKSKSKPIVLGKKEFSYKIHHVILMKWQMKQEREKSGWEISGKIYWNSHKMPIILTVTDPKSTICYLCCAVLIERIQLVSYETAPIEVAARTFNSHLKLKFILRWMLRCRFEESHLGKCRKFYRR